MTHWIGTSGFQYPEWKGTFYPEDLPTSKMLAFYAQRFTTTEVNYSFRRIPSPKTIQNWYEGTPPQFKFSLKAPQKVTHFAKLKNCGDTMGYFCQVITDLEAKLGLVLFQLPPNFKKDTALLADFLECVPAGLRAAFEFLEQSVAGGKIKNYGVATWNGFRAEPDAEAHHSLESMVEIAREIAGAAHHFRFIQLPVNLAMPEALFFQNQKLGDEYVSTVEAAQAFGINVIASGSIMQGQIAQGLPESIRHSLGSLASDAQAGIQFVRSAPGITTALVGMSHEAHVEENLELVRVPPASADALLSMFDQEDGF